MKTESGFTVAVQRIVRGIPAGQTMTYKEVAVAAGRPRAWRAVGTILRRDYRTDRGQTIPCHRVVRSDGKAGSYAGGGPLAKRHKLSAEGVQLQP